MHMIYIYIYMKLEIPSLANPVRKNEAGFNMLTQTKMLLILCYKVIHVFRLGMGDPQVVTLVVSICTKPWSSMT